MPSTMLGCLLCKNQRPMGSPPQFIQEKVKNKEEDSVEGLVKNCSFEGCLNSARITSKYCSKDCSNKNARKRYKERLVA